MNKAIVRCHCGHQVLAKEVLRTDLYERASGREYVYVKFRCRRCKRMGEAFVAENRWDWSVLEPARNEMTEIERDLFLDRAPISELEVLEFESDLRAIICVSELSQSQSPPRETNASSATNRSAERTGEPRSGGLVDDAPGSNRRRPGAEERRRRGANEETHPEDSSSAAS